MCVAEEYDTSVDVWALGMVILRLADGVINNNFKYFIIYLFILLVYWYKNINISCSLSSSCETWNSIENIKSTSIVFVIILKKN